MSRRGDGAFFADFPHGNIDAGQGRNGVIVEFGHVDADGKYFYVAGNGNAQFMAGEQHAVSQYVGFAEHGLRQALFCIELLRRVDSAGRRRVAQDDIFLRNGMARFGKGVEKAFHPHAHDGEGRVVGQHAGVVDALVEKMAATWAPTS